MPTIIFPPVTSMFADTEEVPEKLMVPPPRVTKEVEGTMTLAKVADPARTVMEPPYVPLNVALEPAPLKRMDVVAKVPWTVCGCDPPRMLIAPPVTVLGEMVATPPAMVIVLPERSP